MLLPHPFFYVQCLLSFAEVCRFQSLCYQVKFGKLRPSPAVREFPNAYQIFTQTLQSHSLNRCSLRPHLEVPGLDQC